MYVLIGFGPNLSFFWVPDAEPIDFIGAIESVDKMAFDRGRRSAERVRVEGTTNTRAGTESNAHCERLMGTIRSEVPGLRDPVK